MGDATALLERLRKLPGGPEVLAVAGARGEDVELVGGAVRDMLLDRAPRELDVVVGDDAQAFAAALARSLGVPAGGGPAGPDEGLAEPGETPVESDEGSAARPETTYHERFRTALVAWEGGEVDVATRRAESYPAPGALPEVRAGTPEEDLARRDFTVNALAVALCGERAGKLRAVPQALEDLSHRKLRVLHDQSFLDDPTRILRLARYKARLAFEVEPDTAGLAEQAIAAGALQTVSGARLGAEVRLALAEDDPVSPLAELDRMGVLQAWEPGVCFDEHMVGTALEILPDDGDRELLLCASMVVDLMSQMDDEETEGAVWGFLHDLELPSGAAQRAFSAGVIANCASRWLDGEETTGEMLDLMEGAAIEGLALAASMADVEWGPDSSTRRAIEAWLYEHRHIRLQITGEDLLAAGLPEGPEIGRRLERVFAMRMSGLLEEGREGELSAALADD